MFLDRPEIENRLSKKKRKVLAGTGNYTRKVVKTTLNKPAKKKKGRKKKGGKPQGVTLTHSKPGEPPRRITGLLRKLVFFGLDTTTDTVRIGPLPFKKSITPEVLEFGGRERIVLPGGEKVLANYKARPYLGPNQPEAIDKLRELTERVPL